MKLPAFQFYPGDWVQDTRPLSLAAKGAWIDLLCAMWRSQTRGQLTLSLTGYSRLIGATVDQTASVIKELTDMCVCDAQDVRENNGDITLTNRRMMREEEERSSGASRQAKLREKGGGDPEKWTAIRIPILIRDKYMCAYCGRKADTVDHIRPKSKGGNEDSCNLVGCCKRCNQSKNNRTLQEAGMSFWKGFDIESLTKSDTIRDTNSDSDITPPSSVSSSVSLPETTTKTKTTDSDPAKIAGPPSVSPPKLEKNGKATPYWSELQAHIKRKWEYKKRPNGVYAPTGQDMSLLKAKAGVYGTFMLMALYDEFIVAGEEFWAKQGHSVTCFCKAIDALLDKPNLKAKAEQYRGHFLAPQTVEEKQTVAALAELANGAVKNGTEVKKEQVEQKRAGKLHAGIWI